MKPWKAFLVQLLNIAGTGPIFGALMGACFGPVVFLWIVLGSILGGAVHDYMSGMISCRHRGDSIAELSGVYLGKAARWIMRIFSIVLLTLTGTVYEISRSMLGTVGGALAVVGVVVCPITSGDTAFRSARLILTEMTHLDQRKIKNRLIITLPLLAIGAVLTQLDFNVLWRYFSWSNQTLAMIALWVATAYLLKESRSRLGSMITALPGAFMSAVSLTYILMAEEGFGMSAAVAYPAGIAVAAALFAVYAVMLKRRLVRQAV